MSQRSLVLSFLCVLVVLARDIEGDHQEYGEGGFGWLSFFYGDRSYQTCKQNQIFTKKELKGCCDVLQEAVEEAFDFEGEELRPLFSAEESNEEIRMRAASPRWMSKAVCTQPSSGFLPKRKDLH
eukprot:TRINITY_DN9857_c0_g1_i2.p1 TRINITY_DN9857_c0_g1~~TRINITY_DN9857_c0_g1_i2.p1  ORF type:complete len:125 (+),score=22.70 TRINITY_DN9857_c0_g1_i2:58-432(+)